MDSVFGLFWDVDVGTGRNRMNDIVECNLSFAADHDPVLFSLRVRLVREFLMGVNDNHLGLEVLFVGQHGVLTPWAVFVNQVLLRCCGNVPLHTSPLLSRGHDNGSASQHFDGVDFFKDGPVFFIQSRFSVFGDDGDQAEKLNHGVKNKKRHNGRALGSVKVEGDLFVPSFGQGMGQEIEAHGGDVPLQRKLLGRADPEWAEQ